MSVENIVIDKGCGSLLGKGGLISFNPSVHGADKVGGGVPTEGDYSRVHDFDVKVLSDALSYYFISCLSLHILGLGDVQFPYDWKFFHQKLNYDGLPVSKGNLFISPFLMVKTHSYLFI